MNEVYCIVCPKGCKIYKDLDELKGYECIRGKDYAYNEFYHPKRKIASTVLIKNANIRRLPVATDKEVPKHLIFKIMKEINKVSIEAPIFCNDIIIFNVCNTGVNIIATASMDKIV